MKAFNSKLLLMYEQYGDITEEDILRDVLLALFKELP